MPPEWAPQERLWIGFPGDLTEWPASLPTAQSQAAAFASALAAHSEPTVLVARTEADAALARSLVAPAAEVVPDALR